MSCQGRMSETSLPSRGNDNPEACGGQTSHVFHYSHWAWERAIARIFEGRLQGGRCQKMIKLGKDRD
jgi:hypothetical protein